MLERLERAKQTYQTFLAAVSLSPARLLGQNIQEAEEELLGGDWMVENVHSGLVQRAQNGSSLHQSSADITRSLIKYHIIISYIDIYTVITKQRYLQTVS